MIFKSNFIFIIAIVITRTETQKGRRREVYIILIVDYDQVRYPFVSGNYLVVLNGEK